LTPSLFKVKVNLTLFIARGHIGGISPLILYLCTGCRSVLNVTPPPLYPREQTPVLIEHKAVWTLQYVWAVLGKENLLSYKIRTSNCPINSDSLISYDVILVEVHSCNWLVFIKDMDFVLCEVGNIYI
jgi:hypothetical protein